MDIFQQQNIALAPVFIFEFVDGVALKGIDHLIGKIFRSNIAHPFCRELSEDVMAHGLGEMAFAVSGFGQQEQGILLVVCS